MVEILRTVVGLIGLAIFTEQTVSPSAESGDMGRPLRGVEDRGGVHVGIGRCKGTRGKAPDAAASTLVEKLMGMTTSAVSNVATIKASDMSRFLAVPVLAKLKCFIKSPFCHIQSDVRSVYGNRTEAVKIQCKPCRSSHL